MKSDRKYGIHHEYRSVFLTAIMSELFGDYRDPLNDNVSNVQVYNYIEINVFS